MIKPCGHRLLIRPREVEKVTKGGIHLAPETVERETAGAEHGEIIRIGEDAWFDKKGAWAKVGDMVYYARYAGKVVFDKGERFLLMADEEVMGVIEEDKK